MARRTLNLGILAHVDAGKTTLTERLLYDAGVIGAVGSVDAGTTQTDTLALERQRGITIKAAVVSFELGDVAVNLIDTPGHPDFIAEVERSLAVLDGAVLVVSAVEGVQAQTLVLWRALRRLRIPTLLFVNKTDRAGADADRVAEELARRLGADPIPMWRPLLEPLAERDERLLAAYVNGDPVGEGELRASLAALTRRTAVQPAFAGSAITGEGVAELARGVAELLPAAPPDGEGELALRVFKVEPGPLVYVRLFSGTIRTRGLLFGEKVTAIDVFERGGARRAPEARAGQIARLHGLHDVRIGDAIGRPPVGRQFAPPTLETVVVPIDPEDAHRLKLALTQLAEQDPLIDVRQDEHGTLSVSLFGEVQREVLAATLADEHGLAAEFREATMICVERPLGAGEWIEVLHGDGNPFDATLGYRVEPADPGSGVDVRLAVGAAVAPLHLYGSLELFAEDMSRCVRETLEEGLAGWAVTDCVVTLTHCAYGVADGPPSKRASSSQKDFRALTPIVVMEALQRAGTVVCAPIVRAAVEAPAGCLGSVLAVAARLGAAAEAPAVEGGRAAVIVHVPADAVAELQRRLPGLTRGEGVLEQSFGGYRPLRGEPPRRTRTRPSPLSRRAYLSARRAPA